MTGGYQKSASTDAQQITLPYGATLGRVAGYTRVAFYGHTPTPTLGTDVWEGAIAYPFLSAASKLEILSASASDAAAGTGARVMMIAGLDANYNPISENITLNGTTAVATINSYLRVNGLNIVSAGSGLTNAGDITLRVQGAGAIQAIARATFGYSKSCVYTVPAGFTFLVTDVLPECGGNGTAVNVAMGFVRFNPAGGTNGTIQITNEYNTQPGLAAQRTVITGAAIPEKYSVMLRVTAVGGSPSGAFGSMNGILVDNTQLT